MPMESRLEGIMYTTLYAHIEDPHLSPYFLTNCNLGQVIGSVCLHTCIMEEAVDVFLS